MQKTRLIRLPFSPGRINARIFLTLLLLLFMLSCAFGHFVSKPQQHVLALVAKRIAKKKPRVQITRTETPTKAIGMLLASTT